MAAVVEPIITDAAKFAGQRTKVGPMISKHGGRYLTKSGSHKMPEGGHWKPSRAFYPGGSDVAIGERSGSLAFAPRLIEIATITARGLAGQPVKRGTERARVAEADIERNRGDGQSAIGQ
jgi:hypothetical protein